MNILHLLSNTGYITVNKEIIKKYGLYEAIILGEFASEFSYWEEKGQLTDEGFFFSTHQNIENNTGLTPYMQRSAIRNLEVHGIIEITRKGNPAKNYYKINEFKLFDDKMLKNLTTRCEKTEQQDVKNFNTNNNKINNNKNNNIKLDFETFYKSYPRKIGKKKAFTSYSNAIKDGATHEQIINGLKKYIDYIDQNKIEERFVAHPTTWLNQGRWDDVLDNKKQEKEDYFKKAREEYNRQVAEQLERERIEQEEAQRIEEEYNERFGE